jgi:hypothetical protein
MTRAQGQRDHHKEKATNANALVSVVVFFFFCFESNFITRRIDNCSFCKMGTKLRTALRGQKLSEASDGTEDVPDMPAGDRNSSIDLWQDIKLLAVRGGEGGRYPTITIPIRDTWHIFRAVTSGSL